MHTHKETDTDSIENMSEHINQKNVLERKRVQLFFKRSLDIVVSLFCLLVFTIPFVVIALLIKFDSKGPVFFRQERIGKNGKSFLIWKFRTMVDGAMNYGLGTNVAKNDLRITRLGNILRNFGIDELPQLINVLCGEMSLVGPRPTLAHQVKEYGWYEKQRLLVRPGIASLPLIEGRNLLSWKEKIDLDIQYLSNWTFWLDMKIILRTFWVVLISRKGIYGASGVNDDFGHTCVDKAEFEPEQ